MKTRLHNRKSTIKSIARTWLYTPVIATSFLVSAQPSLATIDNTAVATGTYSAAIVNSPTSNLVQVPVATANPSLSIAKSIATAASINLGADNSIADAGDTIKYQYIITNNGNVTMSSVVPVDPKPKFGTAQVTGTGSFVGFVITAGSATLAPGQSVTYTNIYTLSQLDVDRAAGNVSGPTAVVNTATAAGTPASGIYTPSSTGTATTTIPAGPKLSIVKSASLADIGGGTALKADVGELITYTYVVQNTGNVAITNVSINDTHEGTLIGAGLIKNETLGPDGPLAPTVTSTDATANNAVWSVLQPGATVTFTYVHTVTQTEINNG
jgi:uncharacterized repeat protein (TIGR01451 family)